VVLIFFNIFFAGNVPIDPELTKTLEQGLNFIEAFPDSKVARVFQNIVSNLVRVCEEKPV
jgi:outer membrane cobalamin receptor